MDIKNFLIQKGFDKERIDTVLNAKRYRMIQRRSWHEMRDTPYEEIVDIPLCIKLYNEYNLPFYKIAMLYSVSDVTLREHMLAAGCETKGHACGKNSQNDFFEKRDTPEKAYALGIIASDGSIVKDRKSMTVSITLEANDAYLLKELNEVMQWNSKLIVSHKNDVKPRCIIYAASCKLAQDLMKYGIVQDKSHKDTLFLPHPPLMPEHLMSHYIRGVFDGDGIAYKQGYIGYCGSQTLIHEINEYLTNSLVLTKHSPWYNKSNHIWYTQWSKKEDTKKIADFMYQNVGKLYLKRKYEKVYRRLRPIA